MSEEHGGVGSLALPAEERIGETIRWTIIRTIPSTSARPAIATGGPTPNHAVPTLELDGFADR